MNSYFTCSFCGANELQTKKIIAKGGKDEVAICSECVVLCVGALINISTTIRFTPNENAPLDTLKSGG
ncbi:ClpX C4-type zinc finger protein [Escherichia coli]|uniref:ClpX C4-type zinc finger protein n=1 Tax=Escherichia coli TaxID=562 RepID=UPI0030D002F2